jgi:PhnB protein
MTFSDVGMADDPESGALVMHGEVTTDSGFTIMAADAPPDEAGSPGGNVAIMLSGEDRAQLVGYWDKLSEGGTVAVPLERQSWGDEFGLCADRFGTQWMVNVSQS